MRLSMIVGPYTPPKKPLILNRKNCNAGMYAAISGNSVNGFTGSRRRMNKLNDHPRKQAVITPLECHIEAGIDPYIGDNVSCDTLEYMAAKVKSVPDFINIAACSAAHLLHVSSFAFEAKAFNSFSKFSWVSKGSSDFDAGFGDFGVFDRDIVFSAGRLM